MNLATVRHDEDRRQAAGPYASLAGPGAGAVTLTTRVVTAVVRAS